MMTFSYTSKCQLAEDMGHPTSTCVVTTEAEGLDDLLIDFASFLRGCGYHFDGTIEVQEPFTEEIHK